MVRHGSISFALLLCGLLGSHWLLAADDSPAPGSLRRVLAGDVTRTCARLPTLRSTDLVQALTTLYRDNGYEALWQDTRFLAALQTELSRLVDDGLEPREYDAALQADPSGDVCTELRITGHYLLALEHLSRGRLDQGDHQPFWRAEGLPPATVPTLLDLAFIGLRNGVGASFEQARPALAPYRQLRAAYAGMDRSPLPRPTVPPGPLLRPGMVDERTVPMTRLLQQDGFLPRDRIPTQRYDDVLEQAVRLFQARHGLQVDGIVGPQTLRALNTSPEQRLQQVRINLERLRWINAQRSDHLLLVNAASGHIQLLRGSDPVWQARAQTGRAGRPTPSLLSHINRITLNPSWTVPPTILREDLLPQIRHNPDYLSERNLQVLDVQGNALDPRQVDWSRPGGILLRQPPGSDNPLGQVVFRLPNPYSIFLHDTPSQHIFQQADRNVSSGCVRVEDALALAARLFSDLSDAQRDRIAAQLASGETHEIALSGGPRVILAYWTAFADASGQPAFVPDRYGLDPALQEALSGGQSGLHREPMEVAARSGAGCGVSGD